MTDHLNVWNNCLSTIRDNVTEQGFKTWFEPITPLVLSGNVLTIQVPSQFFYEWLESNYLGVLKKAIDENLGPEGKLEYSVVIDNGDKNNQPQTMRMSPAAVSTNRYNNNNQDKNNQRSNPFELKQINKYTLDSNLNPQYTFENFIEGDCNRLGRSAGHAVATRPGMTSFNPLMIYGGVGLGKTHLLQSIGNKIKENFADKFVVYVSSEHFINQFLDAIRENNLNEFNNFYLQVDALIIDDIQFLSGKEKTQESFFHIFNRLHQSGKQIVMSSDRPPRDLVGLQDRLLSRFKWGLSADVQAPDFETKIAIIHTKMESEGIIIPEDVIEYLAYSVDTNVRELEGVLISLIAQSSLTRKEIDLELAKNTIKNLIHNFESEDVSIDYIQKCIAEHFDVTVHEIKDKTRKKEIVIARQTAMYFAKEYTNLSLKTIGYHFGNRDHSTVIHAITSVNDMMETDKKFKVTIQELQKKLKIRTV